MENRNMYSIFLEEFSSLEDWDKFQYYRHNFEEFKKLANDRLRTSLLMQFANCREWDFKAPIHSSEFTWYFKGFDRPEHFKINVSNCGSTFSISAGNNPYLSQSLSPKLLLDLRFRPLLVTGNFGRVDSISTYKIEEHGNYHFQTSEDGRISKEMIQWFAFHKTTEFVNQIKNKVNRFINDQKLTHLVKELNIEIDNEIADFS